VGGGVLCAISQLASLGGGVGAASSGRLILADSASSFHYSIVIWPEVTLASRHLRRDGVWRPSVVPSLDLLGCFIYSWRGALSPASSPPLSCFSPAKSGILLSLLFCSSADDGPLPAEAPAGVYRSQTLCAASCRMSRCRDWVGCSLSVSRWGLLIQGFADKRS
jgi:hypothetical protein